MALANSISGQPLNTSRGQQFIPEQWLNEIQMFRKARLLPLSMCKLFASDVSYGDTFRIPRISELAVEDKVVDQPVTVTSNLDSEYVIQVDNDKTCSVALDELLEIESKYPLRQPYMQAMGYALAKDITGSILGLRAALYAQTSQNIFVSSNNAISGNGQPFSYAAFLAARAVLFEADVPDNDLCLIVSPRQEASILTINQFISIDYSNNKPVSDGVIGKLMGIDVIRTSLLGANSATGWRNGASGAQEPTPGVVGSRYNPKQETFTALPTTFTGNAAPVHSAILCHKEWAAGVMMKTPRVTQSWENAEQMWLMVSRQAYGTKLYRPNHAVLIHTSAT